MTEKEFKKTEADLFSGKELIVYEALELIEIQGDIRHISMICLLLNETKNPGIRRRIFDILNNLKKPEAVPELMAAVQNTKSADLKRDILTACWNTGLDFSSEFPNLCRIFPASDFATAFEVFTIIDTTAPENISQDIANECIEIINANQNYIAIENVELQKNLLKLFQNVISQPE